MHVERNTVWERGLGSFGSEYSPLVRSCEYSNVP